MLCLGVDLVVMSAVCSAPMSASGVYVGGLAMYAHPILTLPVLYGINAMA